MACKKWTSITKLLALGLSVTFLVQQGPVAYAGELGENNPAPTTATLSSNDNNSSSQSGTDQNGTENPAPGQTTVSGNNGNSENVQNNQANDGTGGQIGEGSEGRSSTGGQNGSQGGGSEPSTQRGSLSENGTISGNNNVSGNGTDATPAPAAGEDENTPVNESNSAATGGSLYARTEEAEGALNKLNNAEPVDGTTGITLLPAAGVKPFRDRNDSTDTVSALYCPPNIMADTWANTLSLWFTGGWLEEQYNYTDVFGTLVNPIWSAEIDGKKVTIDDNNFKKLVAGSVVTAEFQVGTLIIQASTGGQFGASSDNDKQLKDGNGGYTAQVTPQVVTAGGFQLNKQAIFDRYVDQANFKSFVEKMYGTGVNIAIDLYADAAATEPLADGVTLDLSKPLIVRHRATTDVKFELGEGGSFQDRSEDCLEIKSVANESGSYLLTFLVGQGKRIPTAIKSGVSISAYTNKADGSLIEGGRITAKPGMTLVANWKSAYTAEFVLYDHAKNGAGASFDPAILSTPLTGKNTKSSLLAYKETTIDGAINLSQGQKIGEAFSQGVVSGFTQAPSLDPIPADGYRAVFEGWVLSTEPNKIYSSDELSKKILTQSVLITAKWTDDPTRVARVVFQSDANTARITNGLRRTLVTGGNVTVYVRRGEDQRDRFTVSGIPQIRAVYKDSGAAAYDFNGWKERDGRATGWTFTEDETVLSPVWIPTGEVGVTGVRIDDLTSRTIKLNLHEKRSFSASIQGKVASNDAMPALAWVVKEEFNETLGIWQPLTDTNKSTVLTYTADAAAKNRIAQDPTTDKKKKTTWSVTGDKGGKARVEVRVTGAGGTVYSDLVTVEVVVPVKTIAFADGKERTNLVVSSSNGTPVSLLLSSETKGIVPSQRRIYISSSREDDDFYDVYGWETETVTNTDGSTIGRKYVTAGGADGIASFYIKPNDKNLTGQPQMHAGATKLIFTTEANQKLEIKLIVPGYDEDSRHFYLENGEILKNGSRLVGDKEMYFDKDGVGYTDGVEKSGDIAYLIIDGKRYKGSGKAGVYQLTLKETAGRYYLNTAGELQKGFLRDPLSSATDNPVWYYFDPENAYRAVENVWKETSSGKWAYFGADGKALLGKQVVGNRTYFFDKSTAIMKTGWITEETRSSGRTIKFYYDPSTGARKDPGFVKIEGNYYYIDPTDGKYEYIKAATVEESRYYADANGTYRDDLSKGFIRVNGVNTYFASDKDGKLVVNGEAKLPSGETFFMGTDGTPTSGFRKVGKKWVCYDGIGASATDEVLNYQIKGSGTAVIFNVKKNKWYQKDGTTVLNNQWVEGPLPSNQNRYYIVKGSFSTGWKKIGGESYYFDAQGCLLTGNAENQYLITVKNKQYYVDAEGRLKKNTWVQKDAAPGSAETSDYYVGKDGAVLKGKQTISENGVKNTYFFDSMTGSKLTGVQKVGSSLYYLDETTGRLLTGTSRFVQTVRTDGSVGKTYLYVSNKGVVKTGWLKLKSGAAAGSYYFDKNGFLVADNDKDSLITVNKKTFCISRLDASGSLPSGGKMLTGWKAIQEEGGYRYLYFSSTGSAVTGRKSIKPPTSPIVPGTTTSVTTNNSAKNQYFFFGSDGSLLYDTFVKSGKYVYKVNNNGQAESYTQAQTQVEIIDEKTQVKTTYLVNKKGQIKTGLINAEDKSRSYYDSTGAQAKSGLYNIKGDWLYFDATGKAVGALSNGVSYYAVGGDPMEAVNAAAVIDKKCRISGFKDGDKKLKNVILTIDLDGSKKSYLIGGNGKPVTGWYQYTNSKTKVTSRYYIDSTAEIGHSLSAEQFKRTGDYRLKIEGEYYLQDMNGITMAGNVESTKKQKMSSVAGIDGQPLTDEYYVNRQGIIQRNCLVKPEDDSGKVLYTIYVGDDGHRATGWTVVGGKWYLFDGEGKAAIAGDKDEQTLGVDGTVAVPGVGDAVWTNTSTLKRLDAEVRTDMSGRQASNWTNEDYWATNVNGCYVNEVKNQTTGETTVTAYYFEKGKLKTGKIKVYDKDAHTTVTRKFDARNGACVYTK